MLSAIFSNALFSALIISLFLLSSCSSPRATVYKDQGDLGSKQQVEPVVFASAEVSDPPLFPGGKMSMEAYFEKTIQYPQRAYENFVTGEVIVGFLIDNAGNVSDAKIIQGLGYGCDDEVLRVVQAMPNWKPASHEGQAVWTSYEVPVNFSLEFDLGEEASR